MTFPTELTERLMDAHHVKDFDTWLKHLMEKAPL